MFESCLRYVLAYTYTFLMLRRLYEYNEMLLLFIVLIIEQIQRNKMFCTNYKKKLYKRIREERKMKKGVSVQLYVNV